MPIQPPGFVCRLLAIIDTVRAFLAGVPIEDLRFGATAISSWLWLGRVTDGVSRLVARMQAGPLPPLAPRRAARYRRPARVTAPALCPDPLVLPTNFAWLAIALPLAQKPIVSTLRQWLDDPELQPFLAAEPARFTRLLRPLCLAMGLPLPEPLRTEPPAAPPPPAHAERAMPTTAASPPPQPSPAPSPTHAHAPEPPRAVPRLVPEPA